MSLFQTIAKAFTRSRPARSASSFGGTWQSIVEPFAGAWQRGITESRADILTYPTLYACLFRISSDIGKLRYIVREDNSGVWSEVNHWAKDLLNRPNHFQIGAQFREQWMLSKLTHGNTYVLMARKGGCVNGLFILDPNRVETLVTDGGQVFYELKGINLVNRPAGYPLENLTVPATEIIHDRWMAVHHPLIGLPPITAASWAAIKNLKIMRSATDLFDNHLHAGGILTAPAGLTEKQAAEIKDYWEKEFTDARAGKVAIVGADMKFTPFAESSADAQMIEQMKYSDEQICQPFGIPPFKVGIGSIPSGMTTDELNQLYHTDALQTHIEHMEGLLNLGLGVTFPYRINLDLSPLLRMDEKKRADVELSLVQGKLKTPNEGRAQLNLSPTDGGDTLWGQNQDYPLGMLADRESWDSNMKGDKPEPEKPEQEAEPVEEDGDDGEKKKMMVDMLNLLVWEGLS